MNKFDWLWRNTKEEIPGADIVLKKDSLLFSFFHLIGKVVTLGRGVSTWSRYTTTIFRTMYVPDDFFRWSDNARYRLLRHELVHMRQFRRWPIKFLDKKYLWVLNALIMSVCYLLLPLPIFYTFRSKFEREGYTQSLLSYYELYGFSSVYKQRQINNMGKLFGSNPYAFMWTSRKGREWAEKTIYDIEYGLIYNKRDNVLKWSW